jgi:hypothetical protein
VRARRRAAWIGQVTNAGEAPGSHAHEQVDLPNVKVDAQARRAVLLVEIMLHRHRHVSRGLVEGGMTGTGRRRRG